MVCIVSAYYKIPSKLTHETYLPYLLSWFKTIGRQPRVHFFTTLDVRNELKGLVDTGNVNFHILPFSELKANDLGHDFWKRQYARDPEQYHSPELGMVWYEKRYFVERAMQFDTSSVFIWCDAGIIRNEISEAAAMNFGGRNYPLDDNRIHLHQLNFPLLSGPNNFAGFPWVLIGAGILAGNRNAWRRFSEEYEISLQEYDNVFLPAISDQYVTVRCLWKHPDLFQLHDPRDSTLDIWVYLLEVL